LLLSKAAGVEPWSLFGNPNLYLVLSYNLTLVIFCGPYRLEWKNMPAPAHICITYIPHTYNHTGPQPYTHIGRCTQTHTLHMHTHAGMTTHTYKHTCIPAHT